MEEKIATHHQFLKHIASSTQTFPSPDIEHKKMSVQVIVAIVGAIAVILAAVLGNLPWGEWFTASPTSNTPTATWTSASTQAFYSASATDNPISPSSTPLPTEISVADPAGNFISMRLVPAGEFTMGSGDSHEQKAHLVYVDVFYMDTYEVNYAMYKTCVNAGKCSLPHSLDSITRDYFYFPYNNSLNSYPIVNVDWYQAQAYCEWRGAHLPTEAQWEKAARGTDGRTYPWGEGIDCDRANYYGCNDGTMPVGSSAINVSPYGIYDLAGNVWEWVADWYSDTYYDQSPPYNPQGPASGNTRVLRGGSWNSGAIYLHSYTRNKSSPSYWNNDIGFRCVLLP